MRKKRLKIQSVVQLYELLPENERILTDILRQIVISTLPQGYREKISHNVPFFQGNKAICLVWPSTIHGGGIREGVLIGFWYGNLLHDLDNYLDHGTNKQVFYKIYKTVEEIDQAALVKLLEEAVKVDQLSAKTKQKKSN
jgi:hypothetical protein